MLCNWHRSWPAKINSILELIFPVYLPSKTPIPCTCSYILCAHGQWECHFLWACSYTVHMWAYANTLWVHMLWGSGKYFWIWTGSGIYFLIWKCENHSEILFCRSFLCPSKTQKKCSCTSGRPSVLDMHIVWYTLQSMESKSAIIRCYKSCHSKTDGTTIFTEYTFFLCNLLSKQAKKSNSIILYF